MSSTSVQTPPESSFSEEIDIIPVLHDELRIEVANFFHHNICKNATSFHPNLQKQTKSFQQAFLFGKKRDILGNLSSKVANCQV